MPLIQTKFGAFCSQRRSATCRSLAMMAQAIGVEAEYISAVEHGDTPITETYIERVAEYFAIKQEYLLPYAYPERYTLASKVEIASSHEPSPILPGNVILLDDHRIS